MNEYRRNHYVPVWYQQRFIPDGASERRLYYLDQHPDVVRSDDTVFTRNALLRWGPKSCFLQEDLYTTRFGNWFSTDIEKKFFGIVDDSGAKAIEYFSSFTHPSADGKLLQQLLRYMSLQKLRTPKGLAYLSSLTRETDPNKVLFKLQELQHLFCAIWAESIWLIADAKNSTTKFLLSDHPVTTYNMACYPQSRWCRDGNDPHVWLNGTHTIFPLSMEKVLIISNLSWVRNPYGNPINKRPNPSPLRQAMFNFQTIQTDRHLSEAEVLEVNYVIKMRSHRYVAAAKKDWLFPEKYVQDRQWPSFGQEYLFMPDPRAVTFSSEVIIGHKDNTSDAFDAYGRKPWQQGYDDKGQFGREWETFHAFQGEFARRFGPVRRGRSFELGGVSPEYDKPERHRYYVNLERNNKKHRYR